MQGTGFEYKGMYLNGNNGFNLQKGIFIGQK
jgi:hypothetical protein